MNELMVEVLNVMWIVFIAICYVVFRGLRGGYWENNELKGQGISKMETIEVLVVTALGIIFSLIIPFDKIELILIMLVGFIWAIIFSQVRFSKKLFTSAIGFLLVLVLSLGTVLGFQQIDMEKLKNDPVAQSEAIEVMPEEIQSYSNLDYEIIDAILAKSKLLPNSFELVKVKAGTKVNCIMEDSLNQVRNYPVTLETDVYGFKLSGNVFLSNCQLSGTNLLYESVRFTTKPFPEEWKAYKLLPYSKLYSIQVSSIRTNTKSQKDGLKRVKYLMTNYGRTCPVKIESEVKQMATSDKGHKLLVDTTGLMRPKGSKEDFKGNPIFE